MPQNSSVSVGIAHGHMSFSVNTTINHARLQSNSPIFPQVSKGGNVYFDRVSPPRCKKRKGGPRPKIYCEQFEAGEHTMHVGRSPTGRWYTWE